MGSRVFKKPEGGKAHMMLERAPIPDVAGFNGKGQFGQVGEGVRFGVPKWLAWSPEEELRGPHFWGEVGQVWKLGQVGRVGASGASGGSRELGAGVEGATLRGEKWANWCEWGEWGGKWVKWGKWD